MKILWQSSHFPYKSAFNIFFTLPILDDKKSDPSGEKTHLTTGGINELRTQPRSDRRGSRGESNVEIEIADALRGGSCFGLFR